MALPKHLMNRKVTPQEAVWKGPCSNDKNGGITFSLLSRYLVCKHRFKITTVNGLKPAEEFNHRLEYGNMWHICEEAFAAGKPQGRKTPAAHDWKEKLRQYAQSLCVKYPMQQPQVNHWYEVCKVQFPIYIKFWEKHPDVLERKPLLQEEIFNVTYPLEYSGRKVILRGKWDSVDIIGKGKERGIYLQENKSKGQIIQSQIMRQLTRDLQTMIYLIALTEWYPSMVPDDPPIKGVRYNVIRRPLSGGKGTIVKHKPTKKNPQGESDQEFYKRVGEYIETEPETYFMRWKVEISPADIKTFKKECLEPILENLCDDYEWWEYCLSKKQDIFDYPKRSHLFPWHKNRHFLLPFGIHNPIADGGSSDLDEYITSGSMVGLRKVTNLFPELEPVT